MADRDVTLWNSPEKCIFGVSGMECNSAAFASNMQGIQGVSMAKKQPESVIEVEGRQIKLSNLEKVLYPRAGFTKGQVIDYYVRIAPVLLPHLAERPLTLKRYPEGVNGFFFYEKNCPKHRPDWIKTAKIWSEGNNRYMYYCVVEDVATLVWLANLADLELHTSLAGAGRGSPPGFALCPYPG